MQMTILVECAGCSERIRELRCDTADSPEAIGEKVLLGMEDHRQFCEYYGENTSESEKETSRHVS